MDDVVKLGPTIQIPHSWTQGPCDRCGAEDADEKMIDFIACAWFCKQHYDDDMAAVSRLILAALDARLVSESEQRKAEQ